MKEVVQHESSLAVLEEQCDKVQDTLDPDSDEEIIKSRQGNTVTKLVHVR